MCNQFKVVITDSRFSSFKTERKILTEIGAELVVGQAKTEEEIIELARDAHGILNTRAKITAKVINSLENCKVITRYGIGVDTVDMDAATRKGIMVCNVPDFCIDEVANHALTLSLCLLRKVVLSARLVRGGEWSVTSLNPIRRISRLTLGIIGFGHIGKNLASKAKHLGFKVMVFDPYISDEDAKKEGVILDSLEVILKESDIISLHVPLTKNTKGIIGKEQFKLMKPTAYIVNVSRGSLVDEEALIEALQEGQIAGAGLDVLVKEPPDIDNPLLKMENVIVTPHSAYYSQEALEELQHKAAQNVVIALSGKIPKALLNNEVLKFKN